MNWAAGIEWVGGGVLALWLYSWKLRVYASGAFA